MSSTAPDALPRHQQYAIYATGFFCISTVMMMGILTPLWVAHLGFAPFAAGFIIGSRGVLSSLLSIHAGSLMDRLGPRRVVLSITFLGLVTPPLFPIITWGPAMIPLQMVSGLVTSMSWIGAQTLIGQVLHGSARHAGRLTFISKMGALGGPMLIGVMIDVAGYEYSFYFMSLWGAALFICANLLPAGTASAQPVGGIKLRTLLPRFSDYADAYRLLTTTAVAVIATASVIGIASNAILSSFYLVHLENQGFTGTMIGSLVAVGSFFAAFGTLTTHRVMRHVDPYFLLLTASFITIGTICIAPLFAAIPIIFALIALRGITDGVGQPLLFSLLSDAVAKENQGKAVGLRISLNRGCTALVPMFMGGVIELMGLTTAFLSVGVILTAALVILWVIVMRSPNIKAPDGR